jgi:dCTP deaminase
MIVGDELHVLVTNNFSNYKPEAIGSVSLDVHLGKQFEIEDWAPAHSRVITTKSKENPRFKSIECVGNEGVFLQPNGFMQAITEEYFVIPSDVSGFFYMCSSMARAGINHSAATLLQPGWSGNLVLELKNYLKYSEHQLFPGQHIGQVVFYRHSTVANPYSGKYNNQTKI